MSKASAAASVPDAAPRTRTFVADAAIVATMALIARGIAAVSVPPLTGDASGFFELARSVLHGHGFSSAAAPPWTPSFARPPMYPLFIAGIWKIAGESVGALITTQALVDTGVAVLLYRLARERYGRLAALVAAGLYAALPFAAGMSVLTYSESLAGAFVVVAAWAHVRAVAHPDQALRWGALAGVAWGAASLNRPYLSPLSIVSMLVLWWELRADARGRRAWTALSVFLFAGLTVAPWSARNLYWSYKLDQPFYVFQPLGSSAPYTTMYTPGFLAWMRSHEEPFLWSAWNQAPRGPYLDDDERREVAALFEELRARDGVVTPDMDQRFQHVADERYRKSPLRCYVWRRISSALKYWASPRVSTVALTLTGTPGAGATPRWLLALFCFFSWGTTSLFLVGMTLRRDRSILYPAAIAAVTTILLVEIGFGEARYLMPIFGLICVGAGRGVSVIAERFARPRGRPVDTMVQIGS